jgi:hypothetical protein
MRSSGADYCAQTADGFREDVVVSRASNPRRSVPSSVETTTACESVVTVRSVSSDRSGQKRETPKNRRAVAVDAALVAAVSVANAFAIGAEQEAGTKEPDALAYLLGVAIAAPLLLRRPEWRRGTANTTAPALSR